MTGTNGEGQQQDDLSRSVQEILALGDQASRLLGSPVFNVVYNLQLRDLFHAFLETSPKEQNKRKSVKM